MKSEFERVARMETILAVESVLSLAERLRKLSRRRGRSEVAADLRLAAMYLRKMAAQGIVREAEQTIDPVEQQRLTHEAAELLRY
jgi:hypothetical protein